MHRILMCSAGSLALMSNPGCASAQEAPPSTSPAPSTTSPSTQPVTDTAAADAAKATPSGQLGEIIVTAQRRAENLQRAAVPVDVVSPEALLKNGVTTPERLGSLVPALSAPPGGGSQTNFFLRGVGNFVANPIFDSAVAFNYDGVYVGRPGSTSGLFYDLERIEVLKGPQGTLYGRNATGGAINVIPVRPKAGEFSGYATGSYGNFKAINIEGAVNVPLGGDAALRVSGTVNDHNGYLTDSTSDQKTRALRVQMSAHLTPDLSVRVAADYAHNGGAGPGSTYAYAYAYNPATQQYVVRGSGFSPSVGLLDPRAEAFRRTLFAGPAGRTLADFPTYPYENNDFYGANAEINYSTGAGTLTVIPAWRYGHQNNVSDNFGFAAGVLEKDKQYSVETRFVGKRVGPIDYTIGFFYFNESNNGHYFVNQQALINFQDIHQKTKSYAGFARVTGHLTRALRLVGGVRYTADRKSFNGVGDSIVVVCTQAACPNAPLFPQVTYPSQLTLPVPPPGGVAPVIGTGAIISRFPPTPVNARNPKNRVTYRGAVEFDLAPQSLLYASVETGFRSGGFSVATGYETYQPEYITAYTLGSKNRFFHNRLQLNLEGFYWDYRDQQLATIALDKVGRQGFFTQNIGKSKIYGADIESRFLLTPSTTLNAQIQYLHTKYDAFIYQVPTGRAPPFTTCNVTIDTVDPAFRNVDCSGKPSFNSPKWTINLGADQIVRLGAFKAVASVDSQYRSSRYIGFEYQPGQLVGSTWTTNVQLTFGPEDDGWSIAGFVRNLENDRFPVAANNFGIGSALVVLTAPPRTYGARATLKF